MRFFLIMIILGCGNPKARIVDQQITLKDSIAQVEKKLFEYQYKEYGRLRDSLENAGNPDAELARIWSQPAALRSPLQRQLTHLKHQYDSLEMELKKY